MGPLGYGLHPPTVEEIAEISKVSHAGIEICLVVEGAIFLEDFRKA